MAFVEKSFVPKLADEPPHRFNIGVVEGPIRVGGVNPHAGSFGECSPVSDITLNRFAAALVELGDPEFFDLLLRRESEFLFHLKLHRETVTVPPALSGNISATHGLEARIDVFKNSGPDMVETRSAIGGRGALVEDPGLAAGPESAGGADGVIGLPAL